MEKLTVCMVGCGRVSEMYREVFKNLKDIVEVVYAVDTKIERARDFAADFEGCRAVCDYSECFGKNIDVMHIAAPHYLHAPITINALKNGINVLTEKPVAIDPEDADEMIRVSEETGKKLGVIFQTRYVKGCMELKRLIEQGKIGKVLSASSFLTWSRQESYYRESDWKGTWDKEGGGVLINQAIHSIDRVQWLVGDDVLWIEGNTSNRIHKFLDVEDTAEALIKFKNGCLYNLYACNSYCYDAPIRIEIAGEKGKVGLVQDLAWVQIDGEPYYEIKDGYDGLSVGPNYWGCSHITQIKDFYNSVINDIPVFIDGREGKKALEIIKTIYKSSKEKKRIEMF
jgi:predicted dehydrogenase